MAEFDPDAYLAQTQPAATDSGFDPDAYLASPSSTSAPTRANAPQVEPKLRAPQYKREINVPMPSNWQVAMNAVPKGVAAVGDMVGNVIPNAVNLGVALGGTIGYETGLLKELPDLPLENPDMFRKTGEAVGVINPDYNPQTQGQRYLDTGVQAATGALLTGGAGGIKQALANTAGGVVGGEVAQLGLETGHPTIGLLGGLAAGSAVSGLNSGIVQPVGSLLKKGGSAIAEGYTARTKNTPEQNAAIYIQHLAEKSGKSVDDFVNDFNALDDRAIIADLSDNFSGAAKVAVDQHGRVKDSARKFTKDRQLQEQQDVLGVLSGRLGGFDRRAADDFIKASEKQAIIDAAPHYATAKKSPVLNSPELEALRQNDSFKTAYANSGRYSNNLDDISPRDMMLTTGEKTGGARKLTEAEKLHNTKIALADMEGKAIKDGEKGYARQLGDVRRSLTTELDKLPGYAEGRKLWSGMEKGRGAGDIGREFFSMTTREWRDAVSDMTPHQKEVAKMGIMEQAAERAGNRGDNLSTARMMLTENGRVKLRELLSDDDLKKLESTADKWDIYRNTKSRMAGSQTNENLQMTEHGKNIKEAVSPTSAITNSLLDFLSPYKNSGETAQAVGEILTTPGKTSDDVRNILTSDKKVRPKFVPPSLKIKPSANTIINYGLSAERQNEK